MNSVSIDYLKIIKSRELLSLSGISNNNEINKLDIDELVNLESIDGISALKTLRHLSFKKIPKLAVCRDLCAMDWLEDLYTEDCNSLEVQPRPKGQMLKMDLIKYQLKIAQFYQIKNTEKLLAQLETKKETKSSTLSSKEVTNIKKLLQSRDLEMVISAVNMVDSLSDEGLCDVLLDGIKMDGKQLVPNKIFTGTGPAQPFLNTGLLGVLYVASKFSKWSTFLSSIEEIEIETKVLEYMNAFANIKSLNVWNVERVNAPLNLPNLSSFTLTKKNYDNTSLSFSLDIFSNCLNLTHIHIDRFLIISDDINSLTNLVALKELSLIGIQANHINSLQGLANAKWMEKISLQYHESAIGEIIDLNGVQVMDNLKHLTIIGSKIKDTSSLLELTNLEYVEILSPDLVHFTPPKNFQKLAELHFGSSSYSVREFSCKNLKTLGSSFYPENIRKLNFEGTAIVNFPCLTNTKSIGYLSLSNTPICEFSQINTISEIEYLELEHCPNIIDFNGFENVTKINQFSIHNCASLRSFKGFENVITTTNRLDLTECPSIENIEHLPVVDWNYITLYTVKLPIPNPNLILAELRAPLLKSLQGLSTYQKVSSLTLVYGYYQGKHPLSDFSHLQEHKALKRIKISSDMPISLGIFNAFEHLEILNLVGSKNLLDPKDLKDVAIDKLYIADCNLKKADFPDYIQNNIDWQSKP